MEQLEEVVGQPPEQTPDPFCNLIFPFLGWRCWSCWDGQRESIVPAPVSGMAGRKVLVVPLSPLWTGMGRDHRAGLALGRTKGTQVALPCSRVLLTVLKLKLRVVGSLLCVCRLSEASLLPSHPPGPLPFSKSSTKAMCILPPASTPSQLLEPVPAAG